MEREAEMSIEVVHDGGGGGKLREGWEGGEWKFGRKWSRGGSAFCMPHNEGLWR